jgi:hypothetical protein
MKPPFKMRAVFVFALGQMLQCVLENLTFFERYFTLSLCYRACRIDSACTSNCILKPHSSLLPQIAMQMSAHPETTTWQALLGQDVLGWSVPSADQFQPDCHAQGLATKG